MTDYQQCVEYLTASGVALVDAAGHPVLLPAVYPDGRWTADLCPWYLAPDESMMDPWGVEELAKARALLAGWRPKIRKKLRDLTQAEKDALWEKMLERELES